MDEEWRNVPGYEGLYFVSSWGRVKRHHKNGRSTILDLYVGWRRYIYVSLCRDGQRKTRRVHQLVLAAFQGPHPPDKPECRHLDGDGTNNDIGNLAWGSHTENMADKKIHGTDNAGEHHAMAKLTNRRKYDLVKLLCSGTIEMGVLVRQYRVTAKYMAALINNIRTTRCIAQAGNQTQCAKMALPGSDRCRWHCGNYRRWARDGRPAEFQIPDEQEKP